jgi:hypothetical protein
MAAIFVGVAEMLRAAYTPVLRRSRRTPHPVVTPIWLPVVRGRSNLTQALHRRLSKPDSPGIFEVRDEASEVKPCCP